MNNWTEIEKEFDDRWLIDGKFQNTPIPERMKEFIYKVYTKGIRDADKVLKKAFLQEYTGAGEVFFHTSQVVAVQRERLRSLQRVSGKIYPTPTYKHY